jgi:diacylglycerol O-acyltransferase / wax synthase
MAMTDDQQRMLHTDAFSWYMESDPALRSTVVAVAVLERAPDWEHLRKRVDRMTRLVPRLRQSVQEPPWRLGPPVWVTDRDFDLDWHMRRIRLPRSSTWAAVLEVARVAAMADFDRDRPLWEVTEIGGLPDGRVALMTKMHHSLSDGIGGVQLLAFIVDGDRHMPAVDDMPPIPDGRGFTTPTLVLESLRSNAREALAVAARAGGALPRVPAVFASPRSNLSSAWGMTASVARIVRPIMRNASPVMTRRTMRRQLATFDVPLQGLRQAAIRNGGHVNDAFLAGLTGGLRRYHEAHGANVDELRVTMPVSIRKPDDPIGGNRITLLRFAVPVGLRDPGRRIAQTSAISRAWRQEPAIAHTQEIAFGLNRAPRSYLQGVLRKVDFVASDVPGLTEPVFVAGARVLAYYPFGPTIGSAMNATLMSYVDDCNIGLNIDVGAVPDTDQMIAHIRAGFDEVLALAPATYTSGAAAAG